MPGNLNLTPERGPTVWRKQGSTNASGHAASTVGGAVMLAAGAAAAFFGGRMLYRAMREPRASAGHVLPAVHDKVEYESEDSFPASDAPSWTTAGATLERRRT